MLSFSKYQHVREWREIHLPCLIYRKTVEDLSSYKILLGAVISYNHYPHISVFFLGKGKFIDLYFLRKKGWL